MTVKIKKMSRQAIISKVKQIFVHHIGMNNPISTEILFIKITGTDPNDLDLYERAYKWNVIKRILAKLRQSGELFVIMGQKRHYVLSDKNELAQYEGRVDATIRGLQRMKTKAGIWVDSKQLKNLEKQQKKKLSLNKFFK